MTNNLIIIAEIAWAHDGSLQKAIEIMKEAKRSGATAISVHITHMPTYMVTNYGAGPGRVSAGKENSNIFGYLSKINLSESDWLEFAEATSRENLQLVVMPNDLRSLDFCEKNLNVDYYVISAASFIDKNF